MPYLNRHPGVIINLPPHPIARLGVIKLGWLFWQEGGLRARTSNALPFVLCQLDGLPITCPVANRNLPINKTRHTFVPYFCVTSRVYGYTVVWQTSCFEWVLADQTLHQTSGEDQVLSSYHCCPLICHQNHALQHRCLHLTLGWCQAQQEDQSSPDAAVL